jgi:hypothetical protein
MLTKSVQRTVPIPHEPGETMTFRQLNWLDIQRAKEVRSAAVLKNMQQMGGGLLRELTEMNRGKVEEEAAAETVTDPTSDYDRFTLLDAGIVAWSYQAPCSAQNKGDLDEATADWAAREILNLNKAPTEQETEQSFFASPGTSTAPAVRLMNGSSL